MKSSKIFCIDYNKSYKENAILNNCDIKDIYNFCRKTQKTLKLSNKKIVPKIDLSKTIVENAKLNNTYTKLIHDYIKSNNIKLPDGRGKCPNVTNNPFDLTTEAGNYWFGYFLGDGIFSKSRIGICSKDKCIVEKFHLYTNNKNKINVKYYTTNKNITKEMYTSYFGNRKLVSILVDMGVSLDSKTFDTKIKFLNWSIVRGLFDSDGSITKGSFKITSANKNTVQLLKDFFENNLFNVRIIEKGVSFDVFIKRNYKKNTRDDYKRLYSLLYTNGEYFLNRKKVQFATLLSN